MSGRLGVKHSLGTADRVLELCFHPVQPWLAYLDKSSALHVFNWESREVVYSAQFGGVDDSAVHYHGLQRMAEEDTAFWGPKTSQDHQVSKLVSGKARRVVFLDPETLFWHLTSQLGIIKGKREEFSDSTMPGGEYLMGQRWLLVVCENKVVMHEMISHRTREIPKLALEGKGPVSVASLVGPSGSNIRGEPILAVGCADGCIRLINFASLKILGKLSHKSSSISCLMTLHLSDTVTRLVSGSSDGSLCLWDPFLSTAAQGTAVPSVAIKAHEGEVLGFVLCHRTSEGKLPRIFTIGGDKSVAAWEVGTFKEVLRFRQPSQRFACHSICYSPSLVDSSESHPVLLATTANKIWGASVTTGKIKSVAETGALLGTAGKSVGKIYSMVLHPVQTHLIAIGTGSGLAILTAPLNRHGLMEMLPKGTGKKASENEMTVLVHIKGGISQREFMSVQKDGTSTSRQTQAPELVQDNEVITPVELGTKGSCEIIAHSSGMQMAVLWKAANHFKIYRRKGNTSWERVLEGPASQVAWHAHAPIIAVLEIPTISQAAPSERKMKSRSKSEPVLLDSLMGGSTDPVIKVMRIPSTGLIQQVDFVHVSGVPNHLYGGPMLGIAFKPDSNESSTSKHTCRFYDWRTRECYSSEFPAPRWMKWSWEGDLCALAYSSHVLICDASEHFMPIASVPIFEAVSGAWETCQFYVTTPKAVECIVAPRLVDKSDNNPQRSVQVVTLASFRAGMQWLPGSLDIHASLPRPRPIGHLCVLGARGDELWLVDSLGQIVLLGLGNPGFTALRYAGEKNFGAARSASSGQIPADSIASLLDGMGSKAAAEALKLPTLSLDVRLRMALEAGYLKHALVCLEALALGCTLPEAIIRLPAFKDTLKDQSAKEDIADVSFSGLGPMEPHAAPALNKMNGKEEEGIDWDTPLALATRAAPKKLISGGQLSKSVALLGIQLIDAATAAKLQNTAMKAAELLLRHLPPETGSDVLLLVQIRLAEQGKKPELEEHTELSESAKMTISGRFSGLTAAVLSKNSRVMTSTLKNLKMMTT